MQIYFNKKIKSINKIEKLLIKITVKIYMNIKNNPIYIIINSNIKISIILKNFLRNFVIFYYFYNKKYFFLLTQNLFNKISI